MIIVGGTFRLDPANVDAWKPHADKMLAASQAEDGCRIYSYGYDVQEPGLIRIYEEWDSMDHLKAHFATPHMADWRAALDEIGLLSRDVKVYEAQEGEAL